MVKNKKPTISNKNHTSNPQTIMRAIKKLENEYNSLIKNQNNKNIKFIITYFYLEALMRKVLNYFGYKKTTKLETNQIDSLLKKIGSDIDRQLLIKVIYATSKDNVKKKDLYRIKRNEFVHKFKIIPDDKVDNYISELNIFLKDFKSKLTEYIKNMR